MSKRIWGWFFFDWASQPYNTLLLTFIFGPYVKELMGSGTAAQSAWGLGIGAAGLCIAVLAPLLGAISDVSGQRLRWIWLFSLLYVIGAWMLWYAAPGDFHLGRTLGFFALGLIGMEFATIFTNAMLPDLGPREQLGRISGNGWAFGYVGGLIALVLMLTLLAENPATGRTLIGIPPVLGLDPALREGTRAVGPLTALWYAVFMVPFFLWVRDPKPPKAPKGAVRQALGQLGGTLRMLPKTPSLLAYLGASMLYRDALNGLYVFGGIYAAGVLGWDVTRIGIFGILAIVTGAIFTALGGRADSRFGPKPVIGACVAILLGVSLVTISISRDHVLGIALPEGSPLPDLLFMAVGAVIGAAGGALQAASRTMMVHQARPDRMTEAFGLYALSGKATSFLAPLLISAATWMSGSQQTGILPLVFLFLAGLVMLGFVKPDGDTAPR
ncbi:MFS transporter [Pseudooceanicola sp. CBS1P-1]|uniref:MFS transporter n=1 Tax=Pseudooceanicola albus TaxID=2692189 RepID=A0A6L7G957_9RHOB|nr:MULTISPECIES: MFS transporter [Pseudooceanicola]MBT9385886.1 MFS transporter [Pseudooceanicola endophyticus]MXN20117.1 MFS transporter [Pseudooceanicola albus]